MANSQERSVAVIAIHGVGDHAPSATARAIGDLLQDLVQNYDPTGQDLKIPTPACKEPAPEPPQYFPFREQSLRINVRPVVVPHAVKGPVRAGMLRRVFQPTARSPFNHWTKQRLEAGKTASRDEAAFEFMDGQLRCYRGDRPDDTYSTIRLEGSRAEPAGGPKRKVDIYELCWTDLSRLKAGVFSVFTELYQLLFHLSSLGAHSVNAAAIAAMETRGLNWKWRVYRNLQIAAAGLLSVPIPILNLLMFGVALAVSGQALLWNQSLQFQAAAVSVTILLIILLAVACVLWRRSSTPLNPVLWLIPPLFFVLVAIAIFWGASSDHLAGQFFSPQTIGAAAALLSLAIAAIFVWLIAAAYDQRRPNVLRWTAILGGAGIAATAFSIGFVSPGSLAILWSTRLFEVLDLGLWLAWALLFASFLGTFIFGWIAIPHSGTDGGRSRWTGWLTLGIPILSFLTVTTLLWWGIALILKKVLPAAIYYRPWIPALHGGGMLADLPDQFLAGPAENSLIAVLFLALVAVIPAIWGLFPVVLQEISPPEPPAAHTPERAARTGNWLSSTFSALRLSGILLFIATGAVLPFLAAAYLFKLESFPLWFETVFMPLGALSGGLFGALLLLRGQLRKAALGFRPVLEVLLDVDNWLREHPLDRNPKARICGRLVSLLRYVCNVKDEAEHPLYDSLIIVAHSQGTVIAADLLRYLHKQAANAGGMAAYDPELARLADPKFPIWLYTMGCPLRQLYGLRFPDLYGWAYNQAAGVSQWQPDDLVGLPNPNPGDLGVDRWVNAYRSGDYIGRYLWRNHGCDYLWTPDCSGTAAPSVSCESATGPRFEFCIGAGAHTHYWDYTAEVIGRELDRLIATI